jgi:hypothetical protein
MTTREAAIEVARDWPSLLLIGLGVTFAPHLYIGGLFFALASASLARRFWPEDQPVELWWTLVLAAVMSTLAAALAHWYWPDIGPPVIPQAVMAATGYFSRHLARAALRIAGRIEGTSDTITDRLLDRWLPPRGEK